MFPTVTYVVSQHKNLLKLFQDVIISALALRVLRTGGKQMNCTVCGSPLMFDRVVFHCSCGVFVHAYCWDDHVLRAHQPSFDIGTVNLDGQFTPRESKIEKRSSKMQATREQSSVEQTAPLLE